MFKKKYILLLSSVLLLQQGVMAQTFVTDPPLICKGEETIFYLPPAANTTGVTYSWNFGEGSPSTAANPTHQFSAAGNYTVALTVKNQAGSTIMTFSGQYTVGDCASEKNCLNCLSSFATDQNKKYILSAWAKQQDGQGLTTYTSPVIRLSYTNGGTSYTFLPEGNIIDGWQRIYGEFFVPGSADLIRIELANTNENGKNVFFDDIRVHPFDGNMKSYVYDPASLRLVAELDNNNYATFYEYDDDGKLIRVKKESERGIMTIKENRSSTYKP